MATPQLNTPLPRTTGPVYRLNNRAYAYLRRGQFDAAIACYTAILERNPDNATILYNRGGCYLYSDQSEKAIADLTRAINTDSRFADPYITLAMIAGSEGRFEDVCTYADAALVIAPKYGPALEMRGLAKIKTEDYKGAVADLNAIGPEYRKTAGFYNNRAYSLLKMGKHRKALTDISRAIGMQSNIATFYHTRSEIYAALGYHKRALSDVDHAIRMSPDCAAFYEWRSELRKRMGQVDVVDLDEIEARRLRETNPNKQNGIPIIKPVIINRSRGQVYALIFIFIVAFILGLKRA